jgi:hypothetical protein
MLLVRLVKKSLPLDIGLQTKQLKSVQLQFIRHKKLFSQHKKLFKILLE